MRKLSLKYKPKGTEKIAKMVSLRPGIFDSMGILSNIKLIEKSIINISILT